MTIPKGLWDITAHTKGWWDELTDSSGWFDEDLFNPSDGGDITVGLTGNSATFSTGAINSAFSLPIEGISSSFALGSISPTFGLSLTGITSNFTLGNFTLSSTISLTGAATTIGIGSIYASPLISLLGLDIVTADGIVSLSTVVPLPGLDIIVDAGTITPTASVSLLGADTIVSEGIVLSIATISLRGDGFRAYPGNVIVVNPIFSGNSLFIGSISLSPKSSTETQEYVFMFDSVLDPTETIISQIVTCSVYSGIDTNSSSMISGVATVDQMSIKQLVTGGIAGVTYNLSCTISTNANRTISMDALLVVLDKLI